MKINNLARGFLFAASLCGSMTLHAQTWSLNSDNPAVKWYVAPAGAAYGSPDTAPPAPEERLEWTEATVPGTVFAAYVDAGKEKDPNFGDNIHQVDRSKYDREYWYRTEFEVPAELDKELLWLNVRGINRKGTIFLNGTRLGELDGFTHAAAVKTRWPYWSTFRADRWATTPRRPTSAAPDGIGCPTCRASTQASRTRCIFRRATQ